MDPIQLMRGYLYRVSTTNNLNQTVEEVRLCLGSYSSGLLKNMYRFAEVHDGDKVGYDCQKDDFTINGIPSKELSCTLIESLHTITVLGIEDPEQYSVQLTH